MPFKNNCLLGRVMDRCTADPARRGDDELADRMVDLTPEEATAVKQRLRNEAHKLTKEEINVHSKKSDEWK
jgi:hypothetical protein